MSNTTIDLWTSLHNADGYLMGRLKELWEELGGEVVVVKTDIDIATYYGCNKTVYIGTGVSQDTLKAITERIQQ